MPVQTATGILHTQAEPLPADQTNDHSASSLAAPENAHSDGQRIWPRKQQNSLLAFRNPCYQPGGGGLKWPPLESESNPSRDHYLALTYIHGPGLVVSFLYIYTYLPSCHVNFLKEKNHYTSMSPPSIPHNLSPHPLQVSVLHIAGTLKIPV